MTTWTEPARWQQRAAAELASILRHCPHLPPITWTVGPAGSTLTGHVNGLAPALTVEETFHAWASALALDEKPPRPAARQTAYLRAAAARNQVWIRITATLFNDNEPGATTTP